MKRTLFIILNLLITIVIPVELTAQLDTASWQVQITHNLLGDSLTWISYVSAFIFSFFGMFIRWYVRTKSGILHNENSPHSFSFSYWIRDNILPKLTSILSTIIIIFISLRFSVEIFSVPVSMLFAFLIGLSFDYVFEKIQNLKPNNL